MSVLLFAVLFAAAETSPAFPSELVNFAPYSENPLFTGAGPGHWDEKIRERGWIMREGDMYHLWYSGYELPESSIKKLGYATSSDGIHWTRHPDNPVHSEDWVEDMMVVKDGDTYFMFAEGLHDRTWLFTSTDRIHWTRKWMLDIRKVNGGPLPEGPFGTPTVLKENGKWHLLYERDDEAVWLAVSEDLKVWTNVQDEPVIRRGPEPYDRTMIALNQVVKHEGRYYAYYHATCPENGSDRWTMNVAVSDDLVHWTKYPQNPIIPIDHSSGILVHDGNGYRMYCMHPGMKLFFPTLSE